MAEQLSAQLDFFVGGVEISHPAAESQQCILYVDDLYMYTICTDPAGMNKKNKQTDRPLY